MDTKTIISWLGRLVIGAIFIMAGFPKLIGAAESVATFETLGVEPWGRYVTGLLELTSAALVLIPQLGRHVLGAQIAAVIMLGALVSHFGPLGTDHPAFPMAIAVFVSSLVVIYLGRE